MFFLAGLSNIIFSNGVWDKFHLVAVDKSEQHRYSRLLRLSYVSRRLQYPNVSHAYKIIKPRGCETCFIFCQKQLRAPVIFAPLLSVVSNGAALSTNERNIIIFFLCPK